MQQKRCARNVLRVLDFRIIVDKPFGELEIVRYVWLPWDRESVVHATLGELEVAKALYA